MSESGRKAVNKTVARRIKQLKAARAAHLDSGAYRNSVFDFFKIFDSIVRTAGDHSHFYALLELESNSLLGKLERLDPLVKIELKFNDDVVTWSDLKLLGVKILWSNVAIAANPSLSSEEYIDIGDLLLEGLE